MSLNTHVTAPPTGARRISQLMLAARHRADEFVGVAAGTAKPFAYLAAFQEAEPYLGLPTHAFKLIAWLVKQTMACDWEAGSRPIAWPSAKHQEEFLGLSKPRVKVLNRALFEAGIFIMRDNEQGKRYGRRGPDKRIIEAYGFDLSPLAQRCDEFIRVAARARVERQRVKDARKRISIARRSIRQMGELLAGLESPLPSGWLQVVQDAGDLVTAARRLERSEDLSTVASSLEMLQTQAEAWGKAVSEPVDTNPVGLVCKPHTRDTNLNSDLPDTVIAADKSSRAGPRAKASPPSVRATPKEGVPGIRRPSQLLELFPQLERHIRSHEPDWREIVDAAGGALRHELGISASLWAEACKIMGREAAALALAIVSGKADQGLVRSAGSYFGGMVRRAEKGELYLDRSLWALRQAHLKARSMTWN